MPIHCVFFVDFFFLFINFFSFLLNMGREERAMILLLRVFQLDMLVCLFWDSNVILSFSSFLFSVGR